MLPSYRLLMTLLCGVTPWWFLLLRNITASQNKRDGSATLHTRHTMTSVNSPACLLARNHFCRNFPPSPEQMKPVFNCQNDSVGHKQTQVTVWVTMATPPGGLGTKGLWVNIDPGPSYSLHFPTSKPSSPVDPGVK